MQRRIILVCGALQDGGAQRVLSELMFAWDGIGISILLVLLEAYDEDIMYDIPKQVNVVVSKKMTGHSCGRFHFGNIWFHVKCLINLLKKHPNAPVLPFTNPANLVVALCRPFVKNRIIFSERSDPTQSPHSALRRIIRNIIYHVADAYVFQTEDAKKYYPSSIQGKGTVIPNPVNPHMPERFFGKKKKTIVAACRLEPQKNLPMLIKAFSMLESEHSEYTLEIYGSGMEKEKLYHLICSLGLEQRALLLSFANDIYDIMNHSSIYISSSNHEGISNSMLEAMALGLPVVVTDCPIGGARMVVQDGVNGLLVPVDDAEAMYLAMKRVIEEPGLAERLGNEAYKVRERFAIEKIAKEWLDVIEA